MKILIAVDDTAQSRHAVEAAYEFFGSDPAYTILAVQDPHPAIVEGRGSGAFASAAELHNHLEESMRSRAESTMSQAQELLPPETQTTTTVGRAGAVICATAAEFDSDLIVIGSKDKSFWVRLVDPSVGRYLVDHAPCPVLIVR